MFELVSKSAETDDTAHRWMVDNGFDIASINIEQRRIQLLKDSLHELAKNYPYMDWDIEDNEKIVGLAANNRCVVNITLYYDEEFGVFVWGFSTTVTSTRAEMGTCVHAERIVREMLKNIQRDLDTIK